MFFFEFDFDEILLFRKIIRNVSKRSALGTPCMHIFKESSEKLSERSDLRHVERRLRDVRAGLQHTDLPCTEAAKEGKLMAHNGTFASLGP